MIQTWISQQWLANYFTGFVCHIMFTVILCVFRKLWRLRIQFLYLFRLKAVILLCFSPNLYKKLIFFPTFHPSLNCSLKTFWTLWLILINVLILMVKTKISPVWFSNFIWKHEDWTRRLSFVIYNLCQRGFI